MATAPTSRKLNLTRDQLANFLSDQQQIRQFELLFAAVDEIQVIIGTDFEYQADTAAANANNALAQISALAQDTAVDDAVLNAKVQQALDSIPGLAQALELLALAPRQEIGTISSQNYDNVNITGGLISGLDAPLPVASGGIGVVTAPANQVFAGPTVGAAAAPAFRTLVAADIPALPYGSGTVTSVAALTLGTTGTDLSSTVANSTTTPVITLNVPTASATNRGALSAADWTTFNSKQPAGAYVTSVTGTAPVVSSGGTTPAISMAAATNATPGYATAAQIAAIEANTAKVTNATHTGDATGATVLTISNNAVTYAKIQDVTASRLLGRATASTGDVEEITLGTNLSFTGTTLNAASGSSGGSGLKNIIMNGGFTVNQRVYVSGATLAAGAYGHDRWKAGASGGNYSFTQLNSDTTITIASSKTLIQVVENKNVQATAYVLSWTGSAQARIGVNTATPSGSYAASPILITGQTAGTTMSIEFNAGTVGQVQLEPGAVASSFEQRPFNLELSLCQRYLPAFTSISGTVGPLPGMATALGTNCVLIFNHPVPARVPGTGVVVSANTHFNFSNNDGNSSSTAVSFAAGSPNATQLTITVAVTRGVVTTPGWIYANNAAAILYITGCEL